MVFAIVHGTHFLHIHQEDNDRIDTIYIYIYIMLCVLISFELRVLNDSRIIFWFHEFACYKIFEKELTIQVFS